MIVIDRVREIALKTLYEIDVNGAYSNIVLDEQLNLARRKDVIQDIQNKDISFISELVYGTVSWKLTLDEVIKKYSKIRLKKISPWILNILRMSIYQILFLDRVPKSAAVNEGVNLAKRYGHRASSNFVNAILRQVEKKVYEDFFNISDDIHRISITNSMPQWIVHKLIEHTNSVHETEKICKACNIRPKLYIRINTLKTNKDILKRELEEDKIEVQDGELENFLVIKRAKNIEKIKAFQEGKFTVQDEVAGYIPKFLAPKPKEKVLDCCSSPGGKTTAMAELMGNEGEIVAWDLYGHRVKLVETQAKRLGITIIKTDVKDASIYEEKYQNYFDKILLDVPCLGIGVLKRKPDIKWQRKEEDIEEITKLQEAILDTVSKYLKPGGELVYSTCSILKEENQEVIEKFLKNNQNFKQIGDFIQVYPNQNTDGFFIAKCKKIQ